MEQPNVREEKYLFGRFLHKKQNGDCITHQKSAKCSFENCSGYVYLNDAPPRHRSKHLIIGQCNKNDKFHTYSFEYDGYGNFIEIDFRPIEKTR